MKEVWSIVDEAFFEPLTGLEAEERGLASYAMRSRQSRGRWHAEEPHPYRSLYQRDRDRIVHSTAFRRLMHKTQVLVSQTNDHHRTRLTHTLEVAQISRTMARRLGLNEDLTEAIALAHDVGHPPFGHAGEKALDECMQGHGGFEHNLHGLRIVEELEYRYPDFPGLNLSYEVLQSQALHSSRRTAPEIEPYTHDGQPLLEAQVVDAADSLAYDCHDIDDALSVELITLDELNDVPFWRQTVERVRQAHGTVGPLQFQPTVVRDLIDWQVTDLLEQTYQNLQQAKITTIEQVRKSPEVLVRPSLHVRQLKVELEAFLHEKVYRHHRIARMANKGSQLIREMFSAFCRSPQMLPSRYYLRCAGEPLERVVCDYLAGMTDRFAQEEYARLFHPSAPV